MAAYKLYGNEMSFYTGKVRAYLDWKGLSYEEILPSREIFKTVLLPNVGRPVVPVLQTPEGDFIQDSADIIAVLESRHPLPAATPNGSVQKLVTLLLELFADEWMIIPALHYRWAYNSEWSYLEFGKTSAPEASESEQFVIGKKNAKFFENWQGEVGVSETTIPGVEQSYEALLAMLTDHFTQHEYLLGASASYADFSFYGPMYAHLYRDPESGKLMQRLAPRVCQWVERCRNGGTHSETLLGNDAIPETLKPILAHQMREQLPVLTESAKMLEKWIQESDTHEPLPRGFGTTDVIIGQCRGTCLARSFPLYRLQSVLDHYRSMPSPDKVLADSLLNQIGGSDLASIELNYRLARMNNELFVTDGGRTK